MADYRGEYVDGLIAERDALAAELAQFKELAETQAKSAEDGWNRARALAAELAEQVDANTELVRRDVQSCNGLNVANRRVRELETDRDQISLTLAVAKADRDKWFNRARDLEAVLRTAHAELTDHGHQELPECECRIAHVLSGSGMETKGEE